MLLFRYAILALLLMSSAVNARELFDSAFDAAGGPPAEQGWTVSSNPGWKRQPRQDIPALESEGTAASLSRPLTAAADQPLTVVVDYGWRGGRGGGQLNLDLSDAAGRTLRVVMRQDAGKKYNVELAGKELATLDDPILDAGVQSGGVAATLTVVTVSIDPTGKQLTLARLGGGRTTAQLPDAFVAAKLSLVDASRADEEVRLGRVRAFTGAKDVAKDVAAFSMPFGATFTEGTAPRFRLQSRWFSPESRQAKLTLGAIDIDPAGDPKPLPIELTGELKTGQTIELVAEPFAKLPPGLYRLTGEVAVDDIKLPVSARFAVISKDLAGRPQARIPQWMGVVPFINILERACYPESFGYMQQIGVRHVRWLPGWGRLEPEEGKYDWAETDQFMDLVQQHHMQAMFCLSYFGGDWSTKKTGGKLARTPEGREMWVNNFATPVLKRYGDRVKLFQIWNEPDAFWNEDPAKATGFATGFGTPANYFDLLKRTHAAKESLGLKDVRVMASLASGEIPANTKLLLEMGLKDIFDGMIIHTYGNHPRHFRLLKQQLETAGLNNPVLGAGETGLPRSEGDPASDIRQAMKVVNVLFSSTTIPNLACVDWFVLHDNVAGGMFGLLDEKMQPHPAATAYATVARLLSGTTSGEMEVRGALNIYRVQRKGRSPVLAIANASVPALVELAVSGDAKPTVWDIYGRPTTPGVKDGRFTINLESSIMIEGNVSIVSAASPQFTIKLDGQHKPSLQINVGKTTDSGRATVSIAELNFKHEQTLDNGSAVVALPGNLEAGRQYEATVDLELRGITQQQKVTVELSPITRVTDEQAKAFIPPASLKPIEITGEGAFRPFSKKRSYDGPAGNSAKIWLGWTDRDFVLWVEQTDDIHTAIPPQVPNPFGYDSGQWSFQPEGQLSAGASTTEIVFGITKGGDAIARVLGQPHFKPTIEAKREGTTTRYRVTLPASQIGITPAAGVSLGMAVNLNDNDGDGRKGWIYWGQGINGQKNPAMHRRVVLVERADKKP